MSQSKPLHQRIREARQHLREGYQLLKPSYCSFRFKPNYLEALECFNQAARDFKRIGLPEEQIVALEECAKCNKILAIYITEAANYKELCQLELQLLFSSEKSEKEAFNVDKLKQYLSNSSFAYIKAGKFRESAQVYNIIIDQLKDHKEYMLAEELLATAFDENIIHYDDELVRISIDELIMKLLDVYCEIGNFKDAKLKFIQYLEEQLKYKKDINDNSKIMTSYIKLAVIRIINDELYMLTKIIDDMYKCYDSTCTDEIRDVQRLEKAFKEKDKKSFHFMMENVIFLYPSGMLKALRNKFKEVCDEKEEGGELIENNIVNTNPEEKYNLIFGTGHRGTEYNKIQNEEITTNRKMNRSNSQHTKNTITNRLNGHNNN